MRYSVLIEPVSEEGFEGYYYAHVPAGFDNPRRRDRRGATGRAGARRSLGGGKTCPWRGNPKGTALGDCPDRSGRCRTPPVKSSDPETSWHDRRRIPAIVTAAGPSMAAPEFTLGARCALHFSRNKTMSLDAQGGLNGSGNVLPALAMSWSACRGRFSRPEASGGSRQAGCRGT